MRNLRKRFAVFASGRGTNLDNIVRHIRSGKIRADLAIVFSDNPKALALKKAKRYALETLCLSPQLFPSKEAYEAILIKELRRRKIDFVVLAGYMRILSSHFVRAYRGKILNIHPALLPAFKGAHALRDAFDYGVKVTGVTVHFVDESVDHGPIVLQKEVQIHPQDSFHQVEKRVHQVEYELYPRAIQLLAAGRLKIRGRKVAIL